MTMETQHHIKKYFEYHEEYIKKYGENTVVLMQDGTVKSFGDNQFGQSGHQTLDDIQ